MKLKLSFLASILSFLIYAQSAPAYYSGVNFTKTGNALKSDLATLITSTHTKTISYSELKTLMTTSDLDPQNPANLLLIMALKIRELTKEVDRLAVLGIVNTFMQSRKEHLI